MQKVSSQFKYTIDLGIKATKNTFKLRKSKKDKVTTILVLIFIPIVTALMVWDIARGASFVWDIVLLCALVVIGLMGLIMPSIVIHTQKKFLKQIDIESMDYTITEIDKDKCLESYYKNKKIAMQNVCDMRTLMAFSQQENHMFLVFNNFACAIFDIDTLNISKEEFIIFLEEKISNNKLNKYSKKKK